MSFQFLHEVQVRNNLHNSEIFKKGCFLFNINQILRCSKKDELQEKKHTHEV